MKKWKMVLVLSTCVAMLLSGCSEAVIEKVEKSNNTAQTNSDNSTQKEEETKQQEIYAVGDSVKFDDLIITVNGIRNSEGKIMTASEGNVIILVDITAENTGDKEDAVSSMLQTEVVDGDGYSYNLTIAEDNKGSFDGAVGAGRKLRGEVAFQVPQDAESLEFIFSEVIKSGQAIWKIK